MVPAMEEMEMMAATVAMMGAVNEEVAMMADFVAVEMVMAVGSATATAVVAADAEAKAVVVTVAD